MYVNNMTTKYNGLGEITKLIDNLINESMRIKVYNNRYGTIDDDYKADDIFKINEKSISEKIMSSDNPTTIKKNANKKSRKSTKTHTQKIDEKTINKYIEKYLKENPEVLTPYIKDYCKKHLRVDYVKKEVNSDHYNKTCRYTLGLYDGKELLSESVLGMNYGF